MLRALGLALPCHAVHLSKLLGVRNKICKEDKPWVIERVFGWVVGPRAWFISAPTAWIPPGLIVVGADAACYAVRGRRR